MFAAIRCTRSLIVFNWDNILFPTKAVSSLVGLDALEWVKLSTGARESFETFEVGVYELLLAALERGTVKIVANSTGIFIEDSCKFFMPSVWRLLEVNQVEIISTSTFRYDPPRYGSSQAKWKRDLFHRLIEKEWHTHNARLLWPYISVTFMSVGNAFVDQPAARAMDAVIGRNSVRVVTLTECDEMGPLLSKIRRITPILKTLLSMRTYAEAHL